MKWTILVAFFVKYIFTIETMGAPSADKRFTYRCDYGSDSDSGVGAFTLMNTPHDHKHLTYKIDAYSKKLSRSDVDSALVEAFGAWSAVTDLTFAKKTSSDADVSIKFAEYNHNCPGGSAFDGPRNVVGHASKYYVHFDESENWSTGIHRNVINFYAIAVHEIGHMLALNHSPFRESMLYPSYNPRNVVMKLHSDDIEGIQHLYGPKMTKTTKKPKSKGGVVAGNDCWTTGCQLNSWAVVGCRQYQRIEKSKKRCTGGYKYECCTSAGISAPKKPRKKQAASNAVAASETSS